MQKRGGTKLLANTHTGKIRHHKHTSYGSLGLVLLLAFVPLVFISQAVSAFGLPPEQDSSGVYAVVAGPVPKTPPVITTPVSGRVVTTSDPLPVKGTCPDGTLVKVFINEVMAGAGLCNSGTFGISIAPFVGNNSIIARAYNTNDAASPDSQPVSVQLNLPNFSLTGLAQLNSQGAPAGQFFMTTEISHRGAEAGETMTWPLTVSGGVAPYALTIDWGDGKTDLVSRSTAGRFDISHVYTKPGGYRGAYTIIIKSVDQAGAKSFLQLVAIVSGAKPAGVVANTKGGIAQSTLIKLAWQFLAAAILVVASFWLGEKREERIMRRLIRETA